nr:hypothetical protein [Micromonospora sp. DSM 115978]
MAAATLTAACGDGTSGLGTGASSATSRTTTPILTTEPLRAADFVLTEGPETVGFVASPSSADGTDDANDVDLGAVASCLGLPADAFDTAAEPIDEADGDEFAAEVTDFPLALSFAQIYPARVVAADRAIFA